MLPEFFAVTETSVYAVRTGDEGGKPHPYAEKIAAFKPSVAPVGARLEHGNTLAVGKRIIPLTNDRACRCGQTSKVVALFLTKNAAEKCAGEQNLIPADPRWTRDTQLVCSAIGDKHPQFLLYQENGEYPAKC
jgi:hypothetical protein